MHFAGKLAHSLVAVVQSLSQVWLLQPLGLQHTKHPLGVCSSSFPLSRWCHLSISSSAAPFSFCLQTFPASGFNESALQIKWPKYWSFSFCISLSNEYSKLISFRIDWFDLAVQGTLKSLLWHHNSKALILWHSSFFMVQPSHLYMTAGETTALTLWTFAGKVMSLLFNMVFRLVIPFFPRSKCLLISWLQSFFWGARKKKICHCFHLFRFYLPWRDGTRCHDLSFLNVEFQASFFTLLFHPHQEAL